MPFMTTKPSVLLGTILAAFALASVGCSDPPPSGQQPPTSDGGASPSTDGGPENCRWQGYGIGSLGSGQCVFMHLFEHSAAECSAQHGSLSGAPRAIPDQCVSESDEVQVLCCYADGIPDANATNTSKVLTQELVQGDPPLSRADILARAAEACAPGGQRLGDWSLRYAADGVTPDVLRFQCK